MEIVGEQIKGVRLEEERVGLEGGRREGVAKRERVEH
jgi:hypothetical protein